MTTATTGSAGSAQRLEALRAEYESFRARGLALDMTRGKPCNEQLDLSLGLLDVLGREYKAADGFRLPQLRRRRGAARARALFAELLDVQPGEVVVGGNSSLAMMHDVIVQALLRARPADPGTAARSRSSSAEPRLRSPLRDLRAHGIDMIRWR